jgi:acyl dehydratase
VTVYLDRVGTESLESLRTWQPSDCSLYALALGAGFDERAFTLDTLGKTLHVYPTFALTLMSAESESWPDPAFGAGSFDLHSIVLGEQSLLLHRPLDPSGTVKCVSRLAGIYDKGSGALVCLEFEARDVATAEPYFVATASLFVIGEGGFGGERGPARAPLQGTDRDPDYTVRHVTSPVQSLLYRHAGNDANPVHIDPEFAREAGFEGPILTGQNSLGFACRAMVETVAAGEPGRLHFISGRFRSSAYNGDVLTTEIWTSDTVRDGSQVASFRVLSQRGELIIDHGEALLS